MYEFNNGKGADVILCDGDTLPNLSVFFDKGSFYDLNMLINNDKSFKKSDYFELYYSQDHKSFLLRVAGTSTPVSKKGYKLSFDNWLRSSIGKIPDDIVYFADNNVDKLECPPIVDSAIYEIISEAMNSYIDGKKTVDQAAKEIDDKVSIFLNE